MIRWNGKDYSPRRYGKPTINQSIEELMKPLSEKSFKGNVWRAGIIGNVQPTTTPEPTPSANIVATYGYFNEGYSMDGDTWYKINEPANIDYAISSVATDNNVWRGFGQSYDYITSATTNVMFSSPDGINWATGATQGFRSYIGSPSKLLYVAPYWYMVGSSTYAQLLSGGSWTTMAYSSDGLNFNPVNITIPSGRVKNQLITGIAYGNGIYLAVGSSTGTTTTQSRLLYSYDGVNWTGTSLATFSNNLNAITFGNGRFVISQQISANSKILNTIDGFTYSSSTNASDTSVFGTTSPTFILYSNGKYVAAISGGAASATTYNFLNYSTDGLVWSGSPNSKSVIAQSPYGYSAYNNRVNAIGRQSVSGPSRMWYSNDGVYWSANTGNYSSVFTGQSINQIASKTN
jgi:hypothetical protein